jgi:lysophospholipase L1-like esterase
VSIRVTSGFPVDVTVNGGTVKNNGPGTVYYRDESPVTSTLNDGSLVSGASTSLAGVQWLLSSSTSYVDVTAAAASISTSGGSRRGVYLPSDWGGVWLPKMRAAAASGATIALVGDSIGAGLDASTYALSWPGRVAGALQTIYGDGGSGFYSVGRSTVYNALWAPFSWRVTSTGTWTTNVGTTDKNGPGGARVSSTVNGSTLTFTTRGSRVRVYHLIGASFQGYTVTIDGGAPSGTQATAGTAGIGFSEFTGLSTGTHTVVVTAVTNGTNAVSIAGIKGYNTTGVVLDNYAVLGYYSDTMNGAGAAFGAPAGIWSGGTSNPADLVIYSLGVNDVLNPQNVSEGTYLANVRAYLDVVDTTTTDLLFVLPHIGKWELSGAVKNYHLYVSRLRGLAEAYGAGLVDLWTLYRNSWDVFNALNGWAATGHNGLGNSGSDPVHPADTGHGLYADIIAPVVQGIG